MTSVTKLVEESEECCKYVIWYEEHGDNSNEVKCRISSDEKLSL